MRFLGLDCPGNRYLWVGQDFLLRKAGEWQTAPDPDAQRNSLDLNPSVLREVLNILYAPSKVLLDPHNSCQFFYSEL